MRTFSSELARPDYSNSIVNLSNWILVNFGVDPVHEPLEMETGFEKVALFVIDAMGAIALEKVMGFYKPRNFSRFETITSVFPSTTTAALTSIYTASKPSEHGMLGYILFLKEYGFLTNMIEFTPVGMERDKLADRIDFREFVKVESVFQRLSKVDVNSYVISPARYQNSGLAKILHRGAKVVGYTSIGDMVLKVNSVLDREGKSLVVVYVPNADGVGHKESDRAYLNEIAMVLRQIDLVVLSRKRKKTIYIITADHGMIRTPRRHEIWWNEGSEVMKYLEMPPGGERRMMHLYTRNPDSLIDFLESEYPDEGLYLDKEKALELFGGDHNRIGDVILIALGNHSFNYRYTRKDESLKGMHGGLSREEMLVPVVKVVPEAGESNCCDSKE